MIIDSHAHLEMSAFDSDRAEVIKHAYEEGVEFIFSIGNAEPEKDSMERALELCQNNPGMATTIGIHPHNAKIANEKWYDRMLKLSLDENVWAVGEIGLDYHYDFSPRRVQAEVFRDQLHMARELDLPVIIHTREAEQDTIHILEELWQKPNPGGIMHCFSGSTEMAIRCMNLGFYISFAGNITFRKAETLRKVAANIPLERLLLETDSPYLSPVPFRGKRNEPARVTLVAREIAKLHGIQYETVAKKTTNNFKKLFKVKLEK